MNGKGLLVLAIALALILPIAAIGEGKDWLGGPNLDKIYFEVRLSQESGIGDVAAGKIDVFLHTVPGIAYGTLPQNLMKNLNTVEATGSFNEISINSVHDDDSPYLVTASSGELYFNPFAIKEVRYALNFLISREHIVNEIYGGYAGPMYCAIRTTEPPYEPYFKEIVEKQGLTPRGDEQKGLGMIEDAMQKAASDLNGRLVKNGDKWFFDGKPVEITFLIRSEDERKDIGLYVADQIEKSGITVKRVIKERTYTSPIVFGSDPKNYEYTLYTGGWLSSAAEMFPEVSVAQMYAPWYGYMPGFGEPSYWNYKQDDLDAITKKAVTGQCANENEYWNANQKAIDLGIQESLRVFLCHTESYYAVNKRVSNIVADKEAGLGVPLFLRNVKTPDKEIRVAQLSAGGQLFMSAMNPIGAITDVYSSSIWRITRDFGFWNDPQEGIPVVVSTPFTIEKEYHFEGDSLVGELAVPEDALYYNGEAHHWNYAGAGKNCTTKLTFDIKKGGWHHGIDVEMNDVLYTLAFAWEWANQGEDDKCYDGMFSAGSKETMDRIVGIEVLSPHKIVLYVNYIFPACDEKIADYFSNVGYHAEMGLMCPSLPLEIVEAMQEIIVNGSASGAKYSFSDIEGCEQFDLLTPLHVADIKAKLKQLKAENHIPSCIKIDQKDMERRYDAAINWIDERGNALISNGPFYVYSWDFANQFLELRRFEGYTRL